MVSRDREGDLATGQPQGLASEAYLNSTSQGEPVLSLSKEHPRTPGRKAISAVAAGNSSIMGAKTIHPNLMNQKQGNEPIDLDQ